MALPTSRETFIQYIRRDLGEPVICLNVDDEQIEDRVDYSLQWYQEFHYDATEKHYAKHRVTANDYPNVVHSVSISGGGTGYTNGAALVFTSPQGAGAEGTITTDGSGAISAIDLTNNGTAYAVAPDVTVTGGTGATLVAELGGWIPIPENVIGVVKIFDMMNAITNISNMFSIQYQIALNEIWSLSSYSMIPYYTTIQHLNLIQQLLVGMQPIRYQRHKNKLYVDMAWERVEPGQYIIAEVYQVIDPDEYPDIWKDRWLLRYAAAQVKRQWGQNLKKFAGLPMPGNITFNGQVIYDEAVREIAKLEDEMVNSYSIPNEIMTG